MNQHQKISKVAYDIWERAGRPDGEQQVRVGFYSMKLRELHWKMAQLEVNFYLDPVVGPGHDINPNNPVLAHISSISEHYR